VERFERDRIAAPENLENAMRIWNNSRVTAGKARHNLVNPGETLNHEISHDGAFIYVAGGKADVCLSGTAYSMDRYGLFHVGKRMDISVTSRGKWLNYYLAPYVAEPGADPGGIAWLLRRDNPFDGGYGFAPSDPLLFSDLFQKMCDQTPARSVPLRTLRNTALFRQLVYEVYAELAGSGASIFRPDFAETARRYLEANYREKISLQEMAGVLGISVSQLNRLFTAKNGRSPRDYLTETRLNAACSHLVEGIANLKEIAHATGFYDEFTLSKAFKARFGKTPGSFRANNTSAMRDFTIGGESAGGYNVRAGEVSLGKLYVEGVFPMLTKKYGSVIALMLSIMMLFSACGGETADVSGAPDTPVSREAESSPAVETPEATKAADADWPRTYTDFRGEEIVLERRPERIVVTAWPFTELLFVLDYPPIASDTIDMMTQWDTMQSYFERYTVENVGPNHLDINYEKIAELEPDLILVSSANEATHETLARIAPILCMDYDMLRNDWKSSLREVAAVLGMEEEQEGFLPSVIEQNQAYRQELAFMEGKTVGFFRLVGGEIYAIGSGALIMYGPAEEGINLTFPDGWPDVLTAMSLEAVSEMNPDYIFLASDDDLELMGALEDSSVWNALSAVSGDRLYHVNLSLLTGGPLATKLAPGMVVEMLKSGQS
jgi:iron complex transport system substrate-binding protein